MPPKIQCPRCRAVVELAKTAVTVAAKSTFIVPVKQNDEDSRAVLYTRVGIVIASLAVAAFFW